MARALAALVAVAALSSCGGPGDDAAARIEQAAQGRARALAADTTPRPVVDVTPMDAANQLFDFAERRFPELFRSAAAAPTDVFLPYLFRYYDVSRTYLGVKGDQVVVMGGRFGPTPVNVGPLTDFISVQNPRASARGNGGNLLLAAQSAVTVFWDCNQNGRLDAGEARAVSGDDGGYTVPRPDATQGCTLRARTSAFSSNAGSRYQNRSYTMSALPGHTTSITPFSSLTALTGLSPADLERSFNLPEEAIRLAPYLSGALRAQIDRMAIAIADQLQQRDAQIQAGDGLQAGLDIVLNTRALVTAAAQGAGSGGARPLALRPALAAGALPFFDTSGLAAPRQTLLESLQTSDAGVATEGWAVRTDVSPTARQRDALARVVAALRDARVPVSGANAINWSMLDTPRLAALSAAANAAELVPAGDPQRQLLSAGWTAYSTALNERVDELQRANNLAAFIKPRAGTFEFVSGTFIHMFQGALSAAQMASGARFDAAELVVGSLTGGSALGIDEWRKVYLLMKKVQDLKLLKASEQLACVHDLAFFYDGLDSGAANAASFATAAMDCLKAHTDAKFIKILGTAIAAGAEGRLKGFEALKLISSAVEIASELTTGRARSFLELAKSFLDSYIDGAEYAAESGRIADERGIQIDGFHKAEKDRIDRNYYMANLEFAARRYLRFVLPNPVNLPVSWRLVAPAQATEVDFIFGTLTPLVINPSAVRSVLEFGDGQSTAVAGLQTGLRHTYATPGTYIARLSVTATGYATSTQRIPVVVDALKPVDTQNTPPHIQAFGATTLQQGQPIGVDVLVHDDDDTELRYVRIFVGTQFDSDDCVINRGPLRTGLLTTGGCPGLDLSPGRKLFFRVEARDDRGADAQPFRREVTVPAVKPVPEPSRPPVFDFLGEPQWAPDGSLRAEARVRDPEGGRLAVAAFVAGADGTTATTTRQLQADVASGGTVVFAWAADQADKAAAPGQFVQVLFETRDDTGLSVTALSPMVRRPVAEQTVPIRVTDLRASQAQPGGEVRGSFQVTGSTVKLVRVHAGLSRSDTRCWVDLPVGAGAKSFTFSGSWPSLAGQSCSSLLPAAGGTSTLVFKVEARDAADALANDNQATSVETLYRSASAVTPRATVSGHSPTSATQNQVTTFTYSGSNLVAGMGFTVTNCDTTTDLGGSSTSRSFSCVPRSTGAQTLTITPAPGGAALYQGAVNVTAAVVPPSVSSHGPSTATQNVATTFTYSGANLVAGMGFTVTNCDATTDLGGSSTSRSFSCVPRSTGAQTLTIKATPGGATLYNGTVNVSAAVVPPTVSSHSPSAATLNQATTFTYNGANLVAGMGFTVTNCDATTDLGGSSTSRSFSCVPRSTGAQTLTIKAAPGGATLYDGTVNVSAAVVPPTVSNHSPSAATLNQATTFTYNGANLVAGMGFTVTNCDATTDLGGSSTSRSFSCVPRTTGVQIITVKTVPGGATLYTGTVNVTAAVVPPTVSSHSPSSATQNQTTTFTYNGANLVAGMGFTVTNCDTTADLGGTSTSRSFSCVPRSTGAQTLTIKAAPGGSTLYTGTVNVSAPAATPTVSSHSPSSATQNVATTFTYSGANLVAGMGFTVTNCDTVTDRGGSSTSRSFSCVPRSTGTQTLTIKTAPGGTTLYTGTVNVSAPVATPTVSSHSPTSATQNVVTTFTYNGANLVAGMGYTVTNCDTVTDRGGSSTSRSFSCVPRSTGAQTLTIKAAPGGATLYNGTVNVSAAVVPPTVSSHSPSSATQNQATTFTYNGANLVAGMGVTVTNCDTTTDLGGSSTSRSFSCVPRSTGAQTLTIKAAPGGATLYNGTVNVSAAVVPPTVSSHSPSSATQNVATTFTYNGTNLVAGMGFTVTNCDTVTDRGGSSTSRSFSCVPRSTGAQTLTIKAAPGGATLYNGTVNVSAPAATPTVSSHSPSSATQNQATTFTYNGANLVAGMGFTVTNCDAITDLGGSSTSRSFSCVPRSTGAQTLTIKATPGGATLYNGTVNVSAAVVPPTVSSHSPTSATQSVATTFTYNGANLVAGMGFTVTNCDTTTDLGGSSTSRSFSCVPRSTGAQTLTIKSAPGGATLYSGTVNVSAPVTTPAVTGHSPSSATLNSVTTFTYSGSHLVPGMGFTVTNCEAVTDQGGTSTARRFSCIPRTAGAQTLIVKTAPGGTTLYSGAVTVR